MTTLEKIELVALIVLILALAIYYTIKAIKNNCVSLIMTTIAKAIHDAEQMHVSGIEKKKYVLTEIEKVCESNGIPFKFISKLVSRLIDEIISHYNIVVK